MNSTASPSESERRTTANTLFEVLHDDIVKMRLRPGARLSEAEVAKRHEVSRQPVREAFIRLDNLRLLQIRPQRATVVRPMSCESIKRARFMRLGVELEIARRACERADKSSAERLQTHLDNQRALLDAGDLPGFINVDHVFHSEVCKIADMSCAIDIIKDCKVTVDRLCVLSLSDEESARRVYDDHCAIAAHITAGAGDKLAEITRKHLSRLDSTIEEVQRVHPVYFEE